METVLAIFTGLGLGVSLTMVLFRPRRTLPSWPALVQHQPPTFQQDIQRVLTNSKNGSLATDSQDSDCVRLLNNTTIAFHKVRYHNDGSESSCIPVDKDIETIDNVDTVVEEVATTEVTDSNGDLQKESVTPTSSQLIEEDRPRRVLFVIAHPDDECMFFGPSILHFVHREKAMVFLVCLTNGSYTGKDVGRQRQQELWDSCKLLGIPDGHITLYRCTNLPDNPTQNWPIVNTANLINKHLHTLQCDMVVTFDGGGVSGHINHRSLHAAVLHLLNEQIMPKGCYAYSLDSVNILRKYSSILDLPASLLMSSHTITVSSRNVHAIKAAMRAHASQYVWFRKLYMVFSRYVVINTLTPMVAHSTPEW